MAYRGGPAAPAEREPEAGKKPANVLCFLLGGLELGPPAPAPLACPPPGPACAAELWDGLSDENESGIDCPDAGHDPDAKADLETAQTISPADKAVAKALVRVGKLKDKELAKEKKMYGKMFG